MDKGILKKIRETMPSKIAEEILSVQPMPNLPPIEGRSREWLEKNGYEPVSHLGLMWIKKKGL